MYLIPTAQDLLVKMLEDAKAIENSIAAERRNGSSKGRSETALCLDLAKANGLRQAAKLVQIHIDSLDALKDGELVEHLARVMSLRDGYGL